MKPNTRQAITINGGGIFVFNKIINVDNKIINEILKSIFEETKNKSLIK
jgi:hypothetical protein